MSAVKPIPDGYHSVQPYLILQNCGAAIDFYKTILGAKERLRMPRPDGTIGHAELEIGDSCLMMADENPAIGAYSPLHYGGTPIGLHVYVPNCDDVYNRALAAGAKSEREPEDQFYGDRMAGIVDPFGFKWWVATHVRDVTKEELEKAH